MSKVVNFADEMKFEISKSSNGFYVITEEPSPDEEDCIMKRSMVFEEEEYVGNVFGPEKELAELKALLKMFWTLKEFFGISSNNYYVDIKVVEKESGKEVELD